MKSKCNSDKVKDKVIRNVASMAVLIGVLTACGGGDPVTNAPVPPQAPVPKTIIGGVWVVMGSSTAAGAGASAGNGWAALLQRAYGSRGVQIANIAKGSSVTYEGRSTNAVQVPNRPSADPKANVDQALARQPVLLIVSYPTNDIAKGYSVGEAVNNILEIRANALAAGIPVVIMSTQPRDLPEAKLAQLAVIDQRLDAAIGQCFVGVRQVLASPSGKLDVIFDSGDGVHLNDAGHQQVFFKLREIIDSGLCVKVLPS